VKFTADRAQLAEAVKWVAGAISPKPSIPALSGLHMEVAADVLYLTAHNYDQVHRAEVAIDLEVDYGRSAIPVGFMVRDLLGALKTPQVTVEADDRRLTIKGGRSTYGVNLFADWPEFPIGDATHRGVVDADDLRAGIAIAAAAADDDNPNSALRGVRLESDGLDRPLAIVGLQSSRLSAAEVKLSGDDINVQLPVKNLVEAARGLSGAVDISTSDSVLTLADACHSVTLRLFTTEYPKWRKLLERTNPQMVEVEAEELRAAARRATLAAGKGSALSIAVNGGELVIAGAGDEADGTEVVEVTGDGSHTGTWGADVLGSVLATLPSTSIALAFEKTSVGGDVLAITDKAGSFHHVVMGRKATA
jgi:DNA polymerase-3 subunit beta